VLRACPRASRRTKQLHGRPGRRRVWCSCSG
jgi:hypothetical protein